LLIRFFLWQSKRKEKSLAKKKARKGMFRLCGGDQRYARWIGGRFLKKATEKLPDKLAVRSPTNQNLKSTKGD
jgi:hypothetical protein